MITITNKEFLLLSEFIHNQYGIKLKKEKQTLVNSRLQNVLSEKGFSDFTEYYKYISSDKTGEAINTLVNKITTNHTFFMREADHFYLFRDKILPFLRSSVKDRDIRIWSAGCSTGEEPATLAMIMDEAFGVDKINWDTKVLATDISEKVLEIAKKGIYKNEDIATLPANWRLGYFRSYDNNHSVLDTKIKNEIIYRRFNLMEENFPFKRKFHVIFCRNVMIYFDAQTKCELVNKFYNSLERGGLLFIGHSESINRNEANFQYVMPSVYRKV